MTQHLARGAVLLLALAGCQPPGETAKLTVTADGQVDHYRLFVWDSDSKAQLLDTKWVDFPSTQPSLSIGLKLPRSANYTVAIFGAQGDLVNDAPSVGSLLFWADRFVGKGAVVKTAKLVKVPAAGSTDDDADHDLWPSLKFPADVGGETLTYYADKMDLLDCDDTHPEAHPFAAELCATPMIDEDCDGKLPPCVDSDGDGDPDDTDCKPMDPKVHHGNPADPFPESPNCCGRNLGKTGAEASMVFGEPLCHVGTCGDGVDYDCDGQPTKCERDNDCDGALAGPSTQPAGDGGMVCNALPNDPVGTDCNDCDPTVNPNAPEICDGIDNNCNGKTDETCVSCDLDGDGFQRMDTANGCPDAAYKLSGKAVDCNDDDAGVFPGSTSAMFPLKAPLQTRNCMGKEGGSIACALRQACKRRGADGNLQDVDCNGTAAEGCPPATCDADGDGFIDATKKVMCDPGGLAGPYDCDDTNAMIFPAAPDKCGDAIAQNCGTDTVCGVDNDKDGYDTTTDCDDSDPNIHPWAPEICDGKDNDCDGLIDEGNPDATTTGAPMYDLVAKTLMRCNDSNFGECGKKVNNVFTGRCVCSPSSLKGLYFTQSNRVACPVGMPTETQAVDDSAASAPRCYGAQQPVIQTCNPSNPKDDDCDGRDDAPDGKNLAGLGVDCWDMAKGECKKGSGTNSGAKVIGCDKSKVNCFAALGVKPAVNPWLVCDNAASCPVAEKCNGLDDDCDAAVPTNELDVDGDGYMACGPACDLPLKAGLLGCGDCQDGAGMTAIHPNAVETCNNINDDCDVTCDTTTHQCASVVSSDGKGQCGIGGATALPDCCSNQSACRDLKTDFNSCGVCTASHVSNCSVPFADGCVNGGCSCGQLMAPCTPHNWCSSGTCQNCGDDTHCGPSCVTCSGKTSRCKTDQTQCVQCNQDSECNGFTCVNNVCNTTCTANTTTNCDSTHYCNSTGTACLSRIAQGKACTAGFQCLGAPNCTDLVCCDTPVSSCSGCKQCNGATPGVCSNVVAGQDPHGTCVANSGTCTAGGCNGNNACTPSSSGTNCVTPVCAQMPSPCGSTSQCTGATLTTRTCDGTVVGSCPAGVTVGCPNSQNCSSSSTCRSSCSSDNDCISGNYCTGNNCVPRLSNGQQCTTNNQCANNNCYFANGGVKRCSANGMTCPVCQVINGFGTACEPATAGTDPKTPEDCATGGTTCGVGTCNGASACGPVMTMSQCAASVCSGGNLVPARSCDGVTLGCPSAQPASNCPGFYGCADATSCRTSCSGQSDCRDTSFCCRGTMCLTKSANASCGDSCTNCTLTSFNTVCLSSTRCGCNSSSECGGTRPQCDTTSSKNICGECLNDSHCSGSTPKCKIGNPFNRCVGCLSNSDCSPTAAKCDTVTNNTCSACTGAGDCTGGGWGNSCNSGVCKCGGSNANCTNTRAKFCKPGGDECECGGPSAPCLVNRTCSDATNGGTCS